MKVYNLWKPIEIDFDKFKKTISISKCKLVKMYAIFTT